MVFGLSLRQLPLRLQFKADLDDRLYRMYDKIEELEEQLIAEIQIYEERKPNGQRLKSIRFKLPIIENDLSIGLDNGNQVETVALLDFTL